MTRKSLRTCVLLLGLLLGLSSSAYADAVAITSLTVSNFQLVPTSGSIMFLGPQFGSRTVASATASNTSTTGLFEETSNIVPSPTRAEASTNITFANASGVSDFPNFFLSANANAMLSGCSCTATAEGGAALHERFTITGGTGSVDVNVSALVQTLQDLVTDQLSLFAASDIDIDLQVAGVTVFSFDPRLNIAFLDSQNFETQRQISQVLTLQFGQTYNLDLFIRGNARAAQNEVPEPATIVLLISGLGTMAGFVKRRRVSRKLP
jgi:hypothetical protein